MLHTQSQGHWPFDPENEIFNGFLPYMGVVALTFETYLSIVSLGLTFQVRIMASTVLKKSTFKVISLFNALGSKFDLDVK